MKKVRIVCEDGVAYNTKITDAETGQPVPNAYKVEFTADVHGVAKAVIHCHPATIDAVAEAEIKTDPKPTGGGVMDVSAFGCGWRKYAKCDQTPTNGILSDLKKMLDELRRPVPPKPAKTRGQEVAEALVSAHTCDLPGAEGAGNFVAIGSGKDWSCLYPGCGPGSRTAAVMEEVERTRRLVASAIDAEIKRRDGEWAKACGQMATTGTVPVEFLLHLGEVWKAAKDSQREADADLVEKLDSANWQDCRTNRIADAIRNQK